MPSDERLHPASVLFSFLAQLKAFALPGLLVLLGAQRTGADWQPWMLVFIVPPTLAALARYVSFRYRYEPTEMVIHSGILFRNERHIPYDRIQNLDAVQNVAHRALGVIEVRVQTGGSNEPEAVMSVLPLAAFDEMRRRVFAGRSAAAADEGGARAPAAPEAHTLLRLSARDLMIYGFIENRGVIIIAAAFGLLWELGMADRLLETVIGEQVDGRGMVRDIVASVFGAGALSPRRVTLALAALAGVLLFVRVLSMGWALVRLHGFHLTRVGEDLRTEYGLLTRVTATIPLRRVQTLTIRQGPLHRLFGRVAVRVETAGGTAGQAAAAERSWLAPIVHRSEVPRMLRQILPDVAYPDVEWRPLHPRAVRRVWVRSMVFWIIVAAALWGNLGRWTPAVLLAGAAWSLVHARQWVRHARWSVTETAVLFRSGWIWQRASVARFAKVQAVTLRESPFDRRHAMAGVAVDTAGSRDVSDRVDIPYLPRETALGLHVQLGGRASATEFTW